MLNRVALIIVAALAVVSLPAHAERLDTIVLKAREARLAGNKAVWLVYARRAVALAPEHPDLLYSLARAEAANDNAEAAFPRLEDAVRRGGGFDFAAAKELDVLRVDPRFNAIAAANDANLKPKGRAELHVEFADAGMSPEGITYDPTGRRFLVGSLRGEIWQVAADKKVSLFVKDTGLREVLGLKVDAARNLIWAVDGVFPDLPPPPQPKPNQGVSNINAFDLASAARRTKATLDERPVEHGFNDLALARNGDVYVTDTTRQSIYLLKAGATKVEKFLEADDLTFVNGLVLSPDEKTLYVAHVEGISAVFLEARKHQRLDLASDMAVGSIDGLAQKDGVLIGVQNSANLARVIRMTLSSHGTRVAKLEVLAARGPLALGATTGVVVDDAFYVVASPQLTPPGTPVPPNRPKPVILRVPL